MVASSTSVELRLPLPPCPACTNQSRPHGVSTLSVDFFTSFCIEIDPSEQVVWLCTSPATYLPGVLPAAVAIVGAVASAPPMAAATARAIWFLLRPTFIASAPRVDGFRRSIELHDDGAVKTLATPRARVRYLLDIGTTLI